MIKPKHVFQHCLDLVPAAMGAEIIMGSRRAEDENWMMLLLYFVAYISITKMATYVREHYLENELCKLISEPRFYSWMESSQQRQHYKKLHTTLWVISGICLACIFVAAYMDKPFVVYSTLTVLLISDSIQAFQDDINLWNITVGNGIGEDTAYEIYEIVDRSKPGPPRKADVLDIKYSLCDILKRRYMRPVSAIPNDARLQLRNVKSLLELYPEYMSILDRDGVTTPFELACHYSSVDVVQYMIELDEKLLESRDEQGNTPLHWACQNTTSGCVDIVQYLLDLDCSLINICDKRGNTPLHRASQHGCSTIVGYLLEKHLPLVTVANKDGDLPIHLASDEMTRSSKRKRHDKPCNEIVFLLLQANPECLKG